MRDSFLIIHYLNYLVFVPEGTSQRGWGKIYNRVRCEQHTYLHLIKMNPFLRIPQKTAGLSSEFHEVTPDTTQFQGHSEIVLKIPDTTSSVTRWKRKK